MAVIVIADSTARYDGRHLDSRPLGATESSVIHLARELARRRHHVTVLTNCDGPVDWEGTHWRQLNDGYSAPCDLYVAVQHPELLGLVPRATRRALWVLWQPEHLDGYKRILSMRRFRPVPILTSLCQARSYLPDPWSRKGRQLLGLRLSAAGPGQFPPPTAPARPWLGNARRFTKAWAARLLLPQPDPLGIIPLGVPEDVRGRGPLLAAPGQRAVFASNPVRNLRRLVEIWASSILPRLPNAVLDVYGIHELPSGDGWRDWEGSLLPPDMPAAVKASVKIHPTAPRAVLIEAIRAARAMLYLGHECEAFCMVLAEAQALGTPAVVVPIAALPERVIDGVTGFHRSDPDGFASAAIALLTDDALWRRQHEAALSLQQGISWAEAACRFESALLVDLPPGIARAPREQG